MSKNQGILNLDFEELWNSWAVDKDDEDYDTPEEPHRPLVQLKPAVIKCECGSEKTFGKNSPHSSWCAKAKENEK